MIYFSCLLVFPWRVVSFDSPKIQLAKHIYKQGEVIPLKYPFTKYVDLPPIILTRLHNDIIYQLPAYSGSIGKGRVDKWTYSAEIPRHLPPGKYRLERMFIYDINFLRQESYRLMTDEFEVVQ